MTHVVVPKRVKNRPPTHTSFDVRNFSSRNGAPILAVCVHSTESQDIFKSRSDLTAIRNWFDNPAASSSAHVGIDGDGNSERWVPVENKAWACLEANPFTANIEFIARAAQSASEWETAQLKVGAKWAAYWCVRFDIPAQRGVVRNINGTCVCTKKGIITHRDVTAAGFGTHTDPGANFPIDDFIRYTRYYRKNGWFVDLTDNDRKKR